MDTSIDGPKDRDCPRCAARVSPKRFDGEQDRVTWLWKCSCGWSGAVSESGVMSRARIREQLARSRSRKDTPTAR